MNWKSFGLLFMSMLIQSDVGASERAAVRSTAPTTRLLAGSPPVRGPMPVLRGKSSGADLPQGAGMPNLRPFQREGWSGPLVVSTRADTNTDDASFGSDQTLFIDWAALNDGNGATSTQFFVDLQVDGAVVRRWSVDPPLDSNFFVSVIDSEIGPLTPGPHTLTLLVDSEEAVVESNESDNTFSRQIQVQSGGAGQPEEIFFFFPSVQSGAGIETGVAVANPTEEDAEADLFLVDNDGDVLEAAELQIPANGQTAQLLPQLFPSAGQGADAWMVARSSNLGLAGFFLTFTEGARDIDGAEAVIQGGSFLVFPEIFCGDGDFTEINLIGQGGVDLELRAADGRLVQTRRINLPNSQLGRFKGEVSQIFSAAVPDSSYVLARARDSAVIGYESFGSAGFLGGRNAIRAAERARETPSSLFGAQLAEVDALESVITVVNPTDTDAEITLRAFATGVSQGAPAAAIETRLNSMSMLRGSAKDLLGLEEFVGWLRVDSSISGLVGDVSFGDPNGQYLASVQLQRTPAKRIVASHVADGLGFFTGLTFLNPSNDPAEVEIEVFNLNAERTGQGNFTLAPFEHRPRVLSQIIPGFPPQVGGYIRISSEPGIFAFELFSLLSGGNLLSLAAVPPQKGNGAIEGTIAPSAQPTSLARGSVFPMSLRKGVVLDPEAEFVPGDVVVKLRPGAGAAALQGITAMAQARQRIDSAEGVCLLRFETAAQGAAALMREGGSALSTARQRTLRLVEQLNGEADVLYAEPNYLYHPSRVPNDRFFAQQWHYRFMNLPAAWDLTVGSPDVTVAVIDSGAKFDHPDLKPRLTGEQFDFISDALNGLDGDGMDADADDPGDDPSGLMSSYHGTHVAGTVGARTNDGSGVAGVNWVSPLMTLRALGAFGGTNFDIAQAVLYAARLENASGLLPARRADVINMSLGGFSRSQTLGDAVAAALMEGVTVVAAAGNENTDRLSYPASFDGVISVGAQDLSGGRAPYSNFGDRIDVVATGGNVQEDRDGDGFIDGVLSTLWRQSNETPIFDFYQGTSMASPHVAGIASLMYSINPDLSSAQVRQILRDTAIDLGAPGEDDTFGAGQADPVAALVAAGAEPPAAPLLRVSTNSLNFGNAQTQLNVVVSNGGGGSLQVQPPTVEVDQGAGWLSASLSLSTLMAQVDRQGLADGDYTGRIRLNSNGGDAVIEVSMRVGADPGVDPGMLFVLALDPFTFETEATATTDLQEDFQYRISPLPAGGYVLAAGTDNDDDGFICDEGEFCGLYPVSNDPVPVEVEGNRTTTGINFAVQRPGLDPAAVGNREIPKQGFRISRTLRRRPGR